MVLISNYDDGEGKEAKGESFEAEKEKADNQEKKSIYHKEREGQSDLQEKVRIKEAEDQQKDWSYHGEKGYKERYL